MGDLNKNPWIDCWLPRPNAKLRLFCFPHVGASSAVYRNFLPFLDERVELCALELPGRGRRFGEKLFTNLKDLVFAMQVEIQAQQDMPYAFLGHSMGSLIAFEWARLIRQSSLPMPRLLILSAFGAPHLTRTQNKMLHLLPDAGLLAEIERLQGTPEQVLKHQELMALLLPMIRADLQMVETYRYEAQAPLETPMLIMGGDADPEVEASRLKAWKDQSAGKFECQFFSGDHFYIQSAREEVLKKLNQEIQSVL